MTGRTEIYEILSAQAEIEPCTCGCREKDKYGACTSCGQITDTDFD